MKPNSIFSAILVALVLVVAILGWRSRPGMDATPAQVSYAKTDIEDIDHSDPRVALRGFSSGSETNDLASLAGYAAAFSGPWDQDVRARLRALGPVGLFELLLDPAIAARDDGWLWLRDIQSICWLYSSPERSATDVDRWCAPLREKYSMADVTPMIYDRMPVRVVDALPDLPPADAVPGLDPARRAQYFEVLHDHLNGDDPDMVMASMWRLWRHQDEAVSAVWPELRTLAEERSGLLGHAAMSRAGCAVAGDCSATARQTMMLCIDASLGWHCPPGAPLDEVLRQNLTPQELALLNQTLLHWRRGRGG
jgi:hypothetical protein